MHFLSPIGSYSTAHNKIEYVSGYGAVPVNFICVVISSFFAICKNAVHNLDPGETSSYSASQPAAHYVQRYLIRKLL